MLLQLLFQFGLNWPRFWSLLLSLPLFGSLCGSFGSPLGSPGLPLATSCNGCCRCCCWRFGFWIILTLRGWLGIGISSGADCVVVILFGWKEWGMFVFCVLFAWLFACTVLCVCGKFCGVCGVSTGHTNSCNLPKYKVISSAYVNCCSGCARYVWL